MKEKRKKIWIDRFQTQLSLRLALYFILFQAAIWSLVAIEQNLFLVLDALVGSGVGTGAFVFLVGIVLMVGVLFIYDAIKMSHRFVGPLYRVRKTIRAVTAGEEVELVRFRKGDMLEELKDEMNELLKFLEERGVVVLKTTDTKQDQKQPVCS